MKWQPIETAPKDESNVLLFTAGEPRSIVVAYFDAYYAPGGAGFDADDGNGWVTVPSGEEHRLHHASPTHWMPLPPPPEAP